MNFSVGVCVTVPFKLMLYKFGADPSSVVHHFSSPFEKVQVIVVHVCES